MSGKSDISAYYDRYRRLQAIGFDCFSSARIAKGGDDETRAAIGLARMLARQLKIPAASPETRARRARAAAEIREVVRSW